MSVSSPPSHSPPDARRLPSSISFFFFTDTATTEIYTLSLHDALPIGRGPPRNAAESLCSPRVRRRPRSDRKSTRLNSSHVSISYAVFCLKKKSGGERDLDRPGQDVDHPAADPLRVHAIDLHGLGVQEFEETIALQPMSERFFFVDTRTT